MLGEGLRNAIMVVVTNGPTIGGRNAGDAMDRIYAVSYLARKRWTSLAQPEFVVRAARVHPGRQSIRQPRG